MLTQLPLDQRSLNTAMISKPFDRWGGLFSGGAIPVVCVSTDTQNLLGMSFTGYFLFTAKNGHVTRLPTGTAITKCPSFSPFYEVRRR
jgi:hypothetical protein